MLDNNQKLSDRIYEGIKDNILRNVFEPEQRIAEEILAKQYEVSRTPVREALRRLENDGFVVTIQNIGTFVKRFTLKEITDLFDVRGVLEGMSARIVAQNHDDEDFKKLDVLRNKVKQAHVDKDLDTSNLLDIEFHHTINIIGNNTYVLKFSMSLHDRILCFLNRSNISRLEYLTQTEIANEKSNYNHDKILEAIANKDAQEAESLARRHVEGAKKYFIDFCYNRYKL